MTFPIVGFVCWLPDVSLDFSERCDQLTMTLDRRRRDVDLQHLRHGIDESVFERRPELPVAVHLAGRLDQLGMLLQELGRHRQLGSQVKNFLSHVADRGLADLEGVQSVGRQVQHDADALRRIGNDRTD